MRSRLLTPARLSALFVMALCIATLTPLAAQQTPRSMEAADSAAGQASSPATALPGPRLPQWRGVDPGFAPSASDTGFLAPADGNTTIVISTVALVIIVVVVALLIL